MGLFGKLFEKKECDICGGEIGLLGNRRLEDGNMCKSCAKQLSPWFSNRRSSTIDEISEQLHYREENKARVESFNITSTYGENMYIHFDEDQGCFMVADSTKRNDIHEKNPDVIDFADVLGCSLDIDEDKTEIMRTNSSGDTVSYIPRRFKYEYDFYIVINVRNPYFDEIKFQLNDFSVDGDSRVSYDKYKDMGDQIIKLLKSGREDSRTEKQPARAVTCRFCGATTIPDGSGCCEFCGGAAN